MSNYAFRCPKSGLVEWFPTEGSHQCPFCKGIHVAHEVGAPPKPEGYGVTNKPFPRHYSFTHQKFLGSWSDYHQANKDAGLVDTGRMPPFPDRMPLPQSPNRGRHVEDDN